MEVIKCSVCSNDFRKEDLISGFGIRHEIERMLIQDYPEWSDSCFICKKDYESYRIRHITGLVSEEQRQIEELEKEVIKSIGESDLLSSNLNKDFEGKFTFGARISDQVARFGGSWKFIISFFIVLGLWIAINSHFLLTRPFDPFPFILLNLILSCIAAIQAPIIMMSQNRLETKDRARSENDYKINLKSEIEIRTLHEKMDHLLLEQWSKMISIQQYQIELLNEIRELSERKEKPSGNNPD
jgi:uncharacterized membrane protein